MFDEDLFEVGKLKKGNLGAKDEPRKWISK